MKFCGIDWANDHHDALSIDEQGRQLGSIHVSHTPEGLSQLDAYLERMASPGGREQIACIVETTHGLLIAHLLEQGWPVYPVNPRTVERRRAPSGAKTDTIDAYLLAKTGRADFADLRRLNPDSEQVQELKTLTRDQDALIQMQTRLVNQGLPQSLLPRGPGPVRQAAPALDAEILARLSYPASGSRRHGRGIGSCSQTGQVSRSAGGRPTDGGATPAALPASQCGHDAH